jgi:hypothetical protein
MGNLTVPTPVAVAGAALCVLGGFVIGVVAGPDTTPASTAEVVSFDADTEELCLGGEAVADLPEADDGRLCGTWRHSASARSPREGDAFRFVTMTSAADDGQGAVTYIYGDVQR